MNAHSIVFGKIFELIQILLSESQKKLLARAIVT